MAACPVPGAALKAGGRIDDPLIEKRQIHLALLPKEERAAASGPGKDPKHQITVTRPSSMWIRASASSWISGVCET